MGNTQQFMDYMINELFAVFMNDGVLVEASIDHGLLNETTEIRVKFCRNFKLNNCDD